MREMQCQIGIRTTCLACGQVNHYTLCMCVHLPRLGSIQVSTSLPKNFVLTLFSFGKRTQLFSWVHYSKEIRYMVNFFYVLITFLKQDPRFFVDCIVLFEITFDLGGANQRYCFTRLLLRQYYAETGLHTINTGKEILND